MWKNLKSNKSLQPKRGQTAKTNSRPAKPDCRNCGACCVGPEDFGIHADLLSEDIDRLTLHYRRTHVVHSHQWYSRRFDRTMYTDRPALASKPHADGFACVAFTGRVGGPCRCKIYERRPYICRDFEPGSPECLGARKDAKLS
jgi:Fe-S-cluster containining protein